MQNNHKNAETNYKRTQNEQKEMQADFRETNIATKRQKKYTQWP